MSIRLYNPDKGQFQAVDSGQTAKCSLLLNTLVELQANTLIMMQNGLSISDDTASLRMDVIKDMTPFVNYSVAVQTVNAFVDSGQYPGLTPIPSFFAPLISNLTLLYGTGSATFTRATAATCMGYLEGAINGDSQVSLTIPSGIPRFSGARFLASNNTWSEVLSDGTSIAAATLLGYLSEPAATNLVWPSGYLVAGVTQTTAALTAVPYTLSFKGTGSVTGTGGFVGTLNGTGATNKVQLTVTASAAAATLTVTGSITEMQLEIGSFATSNIPTTTAAVTRNADLLNWPNSTWAVDANTTVYIEVVYAGGIGDYSPVIGQRAWAVGLEKGFALGISNTTSTLSGHFADGTNGVDLGALNGLVTKNTTQKIAASMVKGSTNIVQMAIMGTLNTVITGTAITASVADSVDTLNVGYDDSAGSRHFLGNIRNVRIWQTQLPNATLVALTS